MNELSTYYYFIHPTNLLSTILFFIIVIVLSRFRSQKITDENDARLYRLSVYHKLFFSSIFAFYYLGVLKGGDTYAYWVSTDALQNLLFHDFGKFWEIITSESTMERLFGVFDYKTGYPERFIYMEHESFFVSKVLLIFKIITFDGYLATTFILAYIMANSSWKLYEIANEMGIFNKRLISIFLLFLPSVAFWSAGISKDTIVFISILNIVFHVYRLLKPKPNSSMFKHWVLLILFSVLIYKIRPFILFALAIPLIWMYFVGVVNKIKSFNLLKWIIKGSMILLIIGITGYLLIVSNVDSILSTSTSLNEAVVVQQDFQNNTQVYGGDEGKRYSIGPVDLSVVGLLKILPASIMAGIYRPFIWEALSPSLILNGLESIFFIGLTFWFFYNKPRYRILTISKNELLVFSFIFVMIIAFMTGFTSVLFGVLVRIRTPLLPFIGLLLSIDWKLVKDQKLSN